MTDTLVVLHEICTFLYMGYGFIYQINVHIMYGKVDSIMILWQWPVNLDVIGFCLCVAVRGGRQEHWLSFVTLYYHNNPTSQWLNISTIRAYSQNEHTRYLSLYLYQQHILFTSHTIYCFLQKLKHVCFLQKPNPNCPESMSGLTHVTARTETLPTRLIPLVRKCSSATCVPR